MFITTTYKTGPRSLKIRSQSPRVLHDGKPYETRRTLAQAQITKQVLATAVGAA